jgi:putative peptidoglycan lipid II flippase
LWWGAWLLNEGIDIEPNFSASPATRQIGRDLFPILGGEVLVAANLVVDKGFASTLEIGSVAILEFADRARIIPTTLVASTLAMVSFATWSNLHADGKHREARANMDLSLRWILLLASPILAAMYLSRIVLIRTLFERGLFTFQNSLDTAQVLAAYIPGLLFTLMGILTIRAHIIERNLRIIFVLGAASVMANFTLNQMLVGPFGLIGLATSTTVNEILITTIYILCLVHLLPPNIFQRWFSSILIAILCFTLSLVLENLLGIPQAWNDPRLWLSLFSCGALLLVSLFLIRQEGLPMTHRSA